MRYSCKESVEYDLKNHYRLRDKYMSEAGARSEYGDCLLKRKASRGKEYYYIGHSGQKKFEYRGAGADSDVTMVKEYAFYKKALEVIEANIVALEGMLSVYRQTHAENINELLPRAYALPHNSTVLLDDRAASEWLKDRTQTKSAYPVFDPEGLKVTAFDGMKMRSRAEAIHYEAFYIYNVPVVFEFPYDTGTDILRPDFTALDIYRMRDIIWEHLGNWFHENEYKRKRYRSDSVHRWDELYEIGFRPEDNLLLSYGTEDNVFDIQSLHRKVLALALPPPDPETIRFLKRA